MSEPDKNHVSPEELEAAAIRLTELATEQGIRAAVVGGFAGILFGVGRGTGDLDMAADGPLQFGVTKGEPLSFGGEAVTAPNGVPTDWILRDDDMLDLRRRWRWHSPRMAISESVRSTGLP